MRQAKYLLAGGPGDGQWWSAPAPPHLQILRDSRDSLDRFGVLDTVVYTRRIVVVPGWFVPLVIYTTDPLLPPPHGTALPGLIQGSRPDAMSCGPWRYIDQAQGEERDALRTAVRAENRRRLAR